MVKNLLAITAAAGVYAAFFSKKAYAWFGNTHRDILEKAFNILERQERQKVYLFYKDYRQLLSDSCVEPDQKGDVDRGAGRHFYCAATPKGAELEDRNGFFKNRVGDYSKSARTMLEENYTAALSLYKSGKIKESMHMLGRAIHFVQDIGCPVHSSGIRYMDTKGNPHNAFETHAQTKCKSVKAPETIDKRILKAFDESMQSVANRLARQSSKYAADTRTLDPIVYDNICNSTLPTAHQYTASLMMKFYQDVNENNGNFLIDNKSYTFKNERTGGFLTVVKKGVILDAPDSDKEQKMTVKLKDDGSFGLMSENSGYVGKKLRGFDSIKKNTKPAGFKVSALGKRRFRITTQASGFEKVITCNNNGSVKIAKFDPEDRGAVWIIN